MSVDTIGNFLTVIRNGFMASLRSVKAPYSKMNHAIVRILKDEGFIQDFSVTAEGAIKHITVTLRYAHGESAIHEIVRTSKPGRRVYAGNSSVRPVVGGLGIAILTTNKGVMTNKQARVLGVGGEVVCTVW